MIPVGHHSDLPSGAAQPYWYGHDLGFVIDHALYWGCSYIEERVELTQAETDFDLVDAHLDPFDQGSKNSARACYRELGPALSDLLGSRGKPPLRGRIREPRRSRLVDSAAIEKPLAHSAADELLDRGALQSYYFRQAISDQPEYARIYGED